MKLTEKLNYDVAVNEEADVSVLKSDLAAAVDSKDGKAMKKVLKSLKGVHSKIVKDFDKSIAEFAKTEKARLKKEYPDFDIDVLKPSQMGTKRVVKDVGGNSSAPWGDWYDSLEPRLSMTLKIK